MVTPTGKPGVNPEQDVSVPINWAYNHHYMAWMTGTGSEIVKVENDEGEGFGMGYHGRTHHLEARELPGFDGPEGSSSQMFSEGNGGESRKSFHGYPQGYAQLITSPTAWHITPMQIDTRDRRCGATPADVHKCTQFKPWMEPKQSRYGRGVPEATNYSGILECPCNSGYGGDGEFYGDKTKTKVSQHQYAAIGAGVCGGGQDMAGAQDCFASATRLGLNATALVNKTVADTAAPAGCSVVTAASGVATVTWNSAQGAPCTSSGIKVGQASSATNVTVGVVIGESGPQGMSRNKLTGRNNQSAWCTDNKIAANHARVEPFTAKSVAPADLEAAVAACEAYCLSDDACNFCSVDDVGGKRLTGARWWALKSCTLKQAKLPSPIPGDVSSKRRAGDVTLTISGPASGWTGVGFNAGLMSDSPYTIVANSTNVWEQKIGTCGSEAEHCPGTALAKTITVVSSKTADGIRTVVVKRPLAGATKDHYSFNPSAQATIPFITAVGWDDTFGYHKGHAAAVVSLTNPVGSATCLCDKGALAQLCAADGTGCGSFVKSCDPAPAGSLLAQHNPTCNSGQYVGGLRCCHHGRIM